MFDWLFGRKEQKQKKTPKQPQYRSNVLPQSSPVDYDDDILPYVAMAAMSDGGDCSGSDGGCDGGD